MTSSSSPSAETPVAWVFELANYRNQETGEYTYKGTKPQLSFIEPSAPEGAIRGLRALYALPAPTQIKAGETDEIKHMVSRFLTWRPPEHFRPDGGIGFNEDYRSPHGPSGTNLFDATQAEAMVRHMLEGMK